MAQLTDDQRTAVGAWVAAGASLAEVQSRLKEEFGLLLTYMDVRLLALEIGAQVKDKPEPKKAPAHDDLANASVAAEEAQFNEEDALPEAETAVPAGGGAVSVTLDSLVRPGAVVSGEVTFSDGKKARWLLDQMGRLGLDGVPPDYRPTPEDVQAFQVKLQQLLAKRGY